MPNFALNPPNTPIVMADGRTLEPTWYRWFARVQGVVGDDVVALIQAAPLLTYSPSTVLTADKVLTQGAGVSFTSGASTFTIALSTSGVTAASYGTASQVSQVTFDQYGRATVAANVAIAIAASAVTSGTLAVARGGTGLASYAVGDIIYATGATTLAALADVATGNALISGGVGVAPSWGKIGLTTHVSGVLGAGNGGTGVNNTGTITLGGNLTTSGAFTLTLTVTANTNVTLPTTGTLATLAGAENLTNKTVALGSNTVSGTKAQFNTACSDGDFAFLDGATFTGEVILPDTGPTSISTAGYRGEPINEIAADYTLVLGDAGKTIYHDNGAGHTATIPANASVAYPKGTTLYFVNRNGSGVLTIAITSDTLRLAGSASTGSRSLAANGMAKAVKTNTTEWYITNLGGLT